jgi:hypothetical protein
MTHATLDTVTYMQKTQDVVALEKYPNRADISTGFGIMMHRVVQALLCQY